MRSVVRQPLVFALVGLAAVLSGRVLGQGDPARNDVQAAEAAAVDAPGSAVASPPKDIEEVNVRGRKPLAQYRLEIEQAREELVKAYNEANSSNGNDLVCRDERPTGSRVPRHVCRSVAQEKAEATAAKDFLNSLLYSSGGFIGERTATGPPPGGAQVNALVGTGAAQRDGAMGGAAGAAAVEAELERLKKENRQVYRAAVKYVELQKEYEEAQKGSGQ